MQELSKKETIEDMYECCVSISDGYTMDDFKKFLYDLLTDANKISEGDLEKVGGGGLSNRKLYSIFLSSLASFSPLVGAHDLTHSNSTFQRELSSVNASNESNDSLFTGKVKNKFPKLKPLLVGSSITTAGGLVLFALRDSIFGNSDIKRSRELLKEFNDIHEDLKWKLVIDGRYHRYGADIFERYHNGHPGEQGYRINMINALNYTLSNECMNKKFDDNLYLLLHTLACNNVNFNNVDHNLLDTYRFGGRSRMGYVGFGLCESNCSQAGKEEFENKKIPRGVLIFYLHIMVMMLI